MVEEFNNVVMSFLRKINPICLFIGSLFLAILDTNSMENDLGQLGSKDRTLVNQLILYPEGKEVIAEALYQKGDSFYSSSSVAQGDMKQIRKALKCYLSASDIGHIVAHYKVGYIYDCFENKQWIAFHYFKIAADAGHIPSQSCVGFMYFYGRGVDRNTIEAFRYTKAAAVKGYFPALVQLGFAYENYPDVTKNLLMAVGYYLKALQSLCANNKPNQIVVNGVLNSLSDLLYFNEVDSCTTSSQDVEDTVTKEIQLFEGIFFSVRVLTERFQKKTRLFNKSSLCTEGNYNSIFTELVQKYSDLKGLVDDIVPIVTKVYGGLVPGFAVRCVQPSPSLLQNFNMRSTVTECVCYDYLGFYILRIGDQVYSCIGGSNPQIGFTLDMIFKQINSSLTEIDTLIQKLKSSKTLDSQSKLALKEYHDFISIKKFVVGLQEGLMHLIEITTPLRDEYFIAHNLPLFFS